MITSFGAFLVWAFSVLGLSGSGIAYWAFLELGLSDPDSMSQGVHYGSVKHVKVIE